MTQPLTWLLLLMLLLAATCSSSSSSNSWQDEDASEDQEVAELSSNFGEAEPELDDRKRSSASNELTDELHQMRSAILLELQRRAVQKKKSSSGLTAVYKGAKKFGKAVDHEEKKRKRKKRKKKRKKSLWRKLLKILPAPVWIALLAVLTLLLILIAAGLAYLCYRLCCADKPNTRGKPPISTLKHKDLIGDNMPAYGILNYSLEYDLKSSCLIITVNNCIGLPRGIEDMDPYVIVKVDDEKDWNEKSKIIKCNCNPVFNYVRKVKIKDRKLLKQKKLTFEIYDWDIGPHHTMVSRGVLPLKNLGEKLDSILGRPHFDSIHLQKGLELFCRGVGDICVSFSYSQSKKKLSVTVVEAKAVFVMKRKQTPDMETLPNTFVQVVFRQLHPNKFETRRSDLVKQTRNPYFNFSCSFNIHEVEKLKTASLFVELFHKTETLRIKRPVGFIELSSSSNPEGLPFLHWQEVLRSPGSAVAKWHTLEPGESHFKRLDKHLDRDSAVSSET